MWFIKFSTSFLSLTCCNLGLMTYTSLCNPAFLPSPLKLLLLVIKSILCVQYPSPKESLNVENLSKPAHSSCPSHMSTSTLKIHVCLHPTILNCHIKIGIDVYFQPNLIFLYVLWFRWKTSNWKLPCIYLYTPVVNLVFRRKLAT